MATRTSGDTLLGTVLGAAAGFFIEFSHNDVHLATLQQWVAGGLEDLVAREEFGSD